MTGRDEQLGRELRDLDVPAHGPEFFARLAVRLEREAPVAAPARRRIEWPRRPAFLGLAAAAVVLVVFAVSTLVTGNGSSPLRPVPPDTRLISATEVRARVSTALASLRSLSGEVAIECATPVGACAPSAAGGRTTLQWSFALTAAGDERVTAIGRRDDVVYSASRREQRTYSDAGRPSAQVLSNLPAGPPDFPVGPPLLRRDVASVVRAFLDTTEDVPVTDVTEQDRPAWRLVMPVVVNKLAGPGRSGNQLEVIVDQQTGFPLRVTETLDGAFLTELRLSKLVVDGPVDPASFTLDPPAGVQPFRQDLGFRAVALGDVAPVVGYRPVLPAAAGLPPGYVLDTVTVAAQAGRTGNEGLNPQSRNVVSVTYRRGFDRIVVSTRATGTAKPCSTTQPNLVDCWADPVASGEGNPDQPEPFTVAAGALARAQANLVISARGMPHVWTIDSRLVVTVSGDASGEELRRMAESFAPAG